MKQELEMTTRSRRSTRIQNWRFHSAESEGIQQGCSQVPPQLLLTQFLDPKAHPSKVSVNTSCR